MNIRRSPGLSEADADALLAGRPLRGYDDLSEIVGLLRTASTVAAPTPTAALAAVLDGGLDPLPVASAPDATRRRGRWSVGLAAATATAMTVTLSAAAANALPAPIQTAVANVVGAVTPLELPRPASRRANGRTDSGDAGDQPRGVHNPDSGADTGSRESPPARADATPTAPPTDPAEPDADEPDADEPDADEPDADLGEGHEADTDEPGQPGSGDVEQGDVDDREPLDSDERELDRDEPDSDD